MSFHINPSYRTYSKLDGPFLIVKNIKVYDRLDDEDN